MIHDDHNINNDVIINNNHRYKDIIGWFGTLIILLAYFLENIEYDKKIIIICLNLIGHFLLDISVIYKKYGKHLC